jgi:transposase
MPNRKPAPTKQELARIKAMSDSGMSGYSIAKQTNFDVKTVKKWLLRSEVFTDPDINAMIEAIKKNELNDLHLLAGKARRRLHELLDQGGTKVIETVALLDRTFQQRRLLEGGSTENLSVLHGDIDVLRKRRQAEDPLEDIEV